MGAVMVRNPKVVVRRSVPRRAGVLVVALCVGCDGTSGAPEGESDVSVRADSADTPPELSRFDLSLLVYQEAPGRDDYVWNAQPAGLIEIPDWLNLSFSYGSQSSPPTWPPQCRTDSETVDEPPPADSWIPVLYRSPGLEVGELALATVAQSEVVAEGEVLLRLARQGSDTERLIRTVPVRFSVTEIGCAVIDNNPDARFGPDSGVLWNDTDWSTPFCRRFVAERDRIEAAIRAREVAAD